LPKLQKMNIKHKSRLLKMVTAKPNLHQLYESQSETITEFLNN